MIHQKERTKRSTYKLFGSALAYIIFIIRPDWELIRTYSNAFVFQEQNISGLWVKMI
jgi:hypothetical protein